MPDQDAFQDLRFPYAGLDIQGPVSRQPAVQLRTGEWAKTCRNCRNVRGYDPVLDRLRGGSRGGIEKYVDAAVVADWLVQEVNFVVTTGTDVTV